MLLYHIFHKSRNNILADFLKKNKTETTLPEAPANTLLAVQNGTIVPVESLPDPVLAEKVLGDGYAIDPTDGAFSGFRYNY